MKILTIAAVLGLAGLGYAAEGGMRLSSSAFSHGGAIPKVYTCEGEDRSPPLTWHGVPQGSRSLVLIVDDPDVPDPKAPQRVWVHWVLYDLPPRDGELAAGGASAGLPQGTQGGLNDWERTGYGGPCPPIGRHRYFHKLYALDTTLATIPHADKATLLKAMTGHILADTELVGTYQKGQ